MIKCKECNEKMKMFGVTERGKYKYYCNKCHKIIFIKRQNEKIKVD